MHREGKEGKRKGRRRRKETKRRRRKKKATAAVAAAGGGRRRLLLLLLVVDGDCWMATAAAALLLDGDGRRLLLLLMTCWCLVLPLDAGGDGGGVRRGAAQLKSEESWLSFSQEAFVLHNKVRAFAGWPGTRAKVQFVDGNGQLDIQELKIITTRVRNCGDIHDNKDEITFKEDALIFPCAGCSALEVVEIQPPGKKVMNARDFWNGLRGRKLEKVL